MSVVRLPPELERELNATGMTWELRRGSKHYHVVLDGRVVGVLSLSPHAARRDSRNMLRNLRHHLRRVAP